MKKIFAAVMLLFLLISTKNVCALTFQAGTSFYDFKAQNSNTFQRLNYPAVDCSNKSYCYFNTNFAGVAGTIDYVSFQAFVKNDFVPDNTQTFSFNYHLVMNYTEPQLYPAFTNLNSQVAITAVGLSNKFACNTNYSSVSLSSVAIDGTCQVEINNPGHFDNLIINWSSNSFNDVPSTDPLLVYNPNHPISMHWTTESTLYNFNFAISPTQDNLDKINNNLVDINQNLDDLNKKVDDNTNKVIENENKNHQEAEETRKGILQTIIDLPNKFLQMLKDLFIPEDGYFENKFNALLDSITSKLGVLGYPFVFFSDTIEFLLTIEDTGNYVISWNDIVVPNFEDFVIIPAGSFDLGSLLSNSAINSLRNLFMVFVNALLLLSFLKLCHNKYAEIFGGQTDDTEYITTSTEITDYFDSDGVLTGSRMIRRSSARESTGGA